MACDLERTSWLVSLAWLTCLLGCDAQARKSGQGDAGASLFADAGEMQAIDAGPKGALCDPRAPVCTADGKCTTIRTDLRGPWPAPRCARAPAANGFMEREACLSVTGRFDYCGQGLSCTNFGTGEGFCIQQCSEVDTSCSTAGTRCALVDPASGFALCLPSCNDDGDCKVYGRLVCVDHDGVHVCDNALD